MSLSGRAKLNKDRELGRVETRFRHWPRFDTHRGHWVRGQEGRLQQFRDQCEITSKAVIQTGRGILRSKRVEAKRTLHEPVSMICIK